MTFPSSTIDLFIAQRQPNQLPIHQVEQEDLLDSVSSRTTKLSKTILIAATGALTCYSGYRFYSNFYNIPHSINVCFGYGLGFTSGIIISTLLISYLND